MDVATSTDKRILVASADQELAVALQAAIEQHGPASVIVCEDGITALWNIEQHLPDLCILDENLPKLFHYEMLQILRRIPVHKPRPMVLLSSIDIRDESVRRQQGAIYIQRSFIVQQVPKLLDALGRKQGDQPATDQTAATSTPEPASPESTSAEKASPVTTAPAATSPTTDAAAPTSEFPERARRLARTIVYDIALYNQEKFEQGIQENNIPTLLAAELSEGEKLLKHKLRDIDDVSALLHAAIRDVVAERAN